MPELPEVETLRRDAEALLLGRGIVAARVLLPAVLRSPSPERFVERVQGARFSGARRRAKYLLLDLDRGDTFVVALALYGQLLLCTKDQVPPTGVLVHLALDNGEALVAVDPAHFTRLWLVPTPELEAALGFDKLGPEPLAPEFTPALLAQRLDKRRARLKALLLDQHVVAGLGNIYVDEALWRAQLHPARTAASLNGAEIVRLHAAIQAVLREGIADRGTTFHTYRDLRGQPGHHQAQLAVFQRRGQPCPRCGTPIVWLRLASRDTFICPACQPAPD
ncbi:MAG: bifunctional DNA-formamidopyrimidine glycosylase/DNA-(apurinic or apyrimidinic site) lyase [Chloroflexi bacterium]|nr:bifunctional DNA-formamidopyrimidine glycosylase/DNA-(apurinic or apyrimidinic site) lyase [Chloroflexota bacterium]